MRGFVRVGNVAVNCSDIKSVVLCVKGYEVNYQDGTTAVVECDRDTAEVFLNHLCGISYYPSDGWD